MKRIRRNENAGAFMLWFLGLAAALLLTMIFCDDSSNPGAPEAGLPYGVAKPTVGFEQPFMAIPKTLDSPATPMVKDYRQEYRSLTDTLTNPTMDRNALQQSYQAYSRSYDDFQKMR